MSKDIASILSEWPYEPGKVSARRIVGDDGLDKIQLRVDLGVLQMNAQGRPDGGRPFGFESLLEYHEHRMEEHRRDRGSDEGFLLGEEECEELRAEAVQFYYRYLSEFVLEDYPAVARDTARNMRMLDLRAKYAREESDRFLMEQYRPYILMMNARARAIIELRQDRPQVARQIMLEALAGLKRFYKKFGQEELFGASKEVTTLEELLREIEATMPEDPVAKLRHELTQAIEQEQYEAAARLRDRIAKAIRGQGPTQD